MRELGHRGDPSCPESSKNWAIAAPVPRPTDRNRYGPLSQNRGTSVAKTPPSMRRIVLLLALLVPSAAWGGESVRPTAMVVGERAQSDAFLAAVRAHLATSRSEIGKNTFDALESGAIELGTMDNLTLGDCRRLVEENPRQWEGIVSADECVEGRVPKKILEKVSGYQHENRIYVRASGKISDAAATVVHETNHVANKTHERYGSSREILEEEYRAYYVTLLYQDGRAPGAGYLSWLKGWIVEQYALDVAPSLGDVPAGVLDNSIAPEMVAVAP